MATQRATRWRTTNRSWKDPGDVSDDFENCDFFVDESLFDDPYPYWEYVRATKGPVWIDPRYDVAVVTGHAEETEVLRDHASFSSCNSPTGPFPGLPVKVEGDDADPVICEHRSKCRCTSSW